jgi:hypothetical protein
MAEAGPGQLENLLALNFPQTRQAQFLVHFLWGHGALTLGPPGQLIR